MNGCTRRAAPYISHPAGLVGAFDAPHVAFVRTADPAVPGVVDILFAGDARIHEGVCRAGNPVAFSDAYKRLLEAAESSVLVGYFAYEFGFQFEAASWDHLDVADDQRLFCFLELACWYEADHEAGTGAICALPGTPESAIAEFEVGLRRALQVKGAVLQSSRRSESALSFNDIAALGELSREQYIEAVEQILQDINAGTYYELNFTQRFRAESDISPSVVFSRLMERLAPAYGFYGRFGDEYVISASPELFLYKAGKFIQTCPIKGSYSGDPDEAERAKLHAEHIMVVDLARNDLGRISDASWVQVAEQGVARQFGAITHLESRIIAETSHSLGDVLAATMPAASITGMPKVICVQHIGKYERSPRGVYTGNCGIIRTAEDMQLNVAIRTLYCRKGKTGEGWQYCVGAGGAIVADSDAEQEYNECLMKARPLLQALF